jgi:wyosine [tRNA(Phe)-imidazoG37] synthetase (radical SAM superfamily)
MGFLFHEVVFGPVRSRRLGLSLGINLLPAHSKFCSFNCIYCECGWTPPGQDEPQLLPKREEVYSYLEERLKQLVAEDYLPDAITYAGNGEPTLHPDFPGIVQDTIFLRDKYVPEAKVTVLSNASRISDPLIFNAQLSLDNNILKLDAGSEQLFRLINNPVSPIDFDELVTNLAKFEGKVIIQSMFLRGSFNGQIIDNTTEEAVSDWIGQLKKIRPKQIMIYPIARDTPVHNLAKISLAELDSIAEKVKVSGFNVSVYS